MTSLSVDKDGWATQGGPSRPSEGFGKPALEVLVVDSGVRAAIRTKFQAQDLQPERNLVPNTLCDDYSDCYFCDCSSKNSYSDYSHIAAAAN